jgi:Phage integrase family
VRTRLTIDHRIRDLALFNLAIDSKLRGCDLVKLRLNDVIAGMAVRTRSTVIQQKTSRPVPFELTEPTRDAITNWMHVRIARNGDWLFPSRSNADGHLTTRQYARLVDDWITMIGLDSSNYGTHSLRRTKVAMVYKRTGNLRACQLLLRTPTHCPITGQRRHDPLSISSALRGDGGHSTKARALWRRDGGAFAARYVARPTSSLDAERCRGQHDRSGRAAFSP